MASALLLRVVMLNRLKTILSLPLLAGLLGLGFTFRRTYGSITRFVRSRFANRDVASEKANPDHV